VKNQNKEKFKRGMMVIEVKQALLYFTQVIEHFSPTKISPTTQANHQAIESFFSPNQENYETNVWQELRKVIT